MKRIFDPEKGTWVLLCFVAFFGVVIAVNTVFIKSALKTHSGLVTEQPYRKGLAYDETLEKARAQENIEHKASYGNGTLRLTLPFDDATVRADILRLVKDGQDFSITLKFVSNGMYEAPLTFPMKGKWVAAFTAERKDGSEFQARYDFVVK